MQWQQRSARWHAAALVIGLLAPHACHAGNVPLDWSGMTNQGSLQGPGDATSYGAGQDFQGSCSFGQNGANSNNLAWHNGIDMTIALNGVQFANGSACGACVSFIGLGAGIGTMPVSTTTWQTALITDRCGECARGDIDRAIDGNGRWTVQWYMHPCPVGNTKLVYSVVDLHPYFMSIVVSNHFVPIATMEFNMFGDWMPIDRTTNNRYSYYNSQGMYKFPFQIRMTSIAGEVLTDTVTSSSGNTGLVQFSQTGIPSNYDVITSYWETLGPNAALVTPATANSPAINASATAAAAAVPSSPAAAAAPVSPEPAAEPASPITVSRSPAAVISAPSSPVISAGQTYSIINGGQCGGNSGDCSEVSACADAPWPGASCSAGYACQRYAPASGGWWQCNPSSSSQPATSVYATPSSSGSSAAAVSVATAGRRLLMRQSAA